VLRPHLLHPQPFHLLSPERFSFCCNALKIGRPLPDCMPFGMQFACAKPFNGHLPIQAGLRCHDGLPGCRTCRAAQGGAQRPRGAGSILRDESETGRRSDRFGHFSDGRLPLVSEDRLGVSQVGGGENAQAGVLCDRRRRRKRDGRRSPGQNSLPSPGYTSFEKRLIDYHL
jgi:hypothetical protein